MKKRNEGFSLVELLIVFIIIGIVAAIAIPKLLSSRRSANEASALAAVRKVNSAQATFLSTAGNGRYATAAELWQNQLIGPRTAAAANVNVGGNPATNMARDGYRFRITSTPANPSAGVPSTFVISANPSSTSGVTQTGAKRYCLTETGLLKSSLQNLSTVYNYAQCGFANPHVP